MHTNTFGIANQIAGTLHKVYSIAHGSGVVLIIKDSDDQLYEINIAPAKFGKYFEDIKKFLMKSPNPQDKTILQKLKSQEAKGSMPIENWPTEIGPDSENNKIN